MFSFKQFRQLQKEEFEKSEIEIANKTSRTIGAVGAKAIVPRYVEEIESNFNNKEKRKILDFGAGKDAAHTIRLREKGFDVTAHEFGDNQKEGLHDPKALDKKYDHVYASNVLNVQSSKRMMSKTLDQIHDSLKKNGLFTANFPTSPRKSEDIDIEYILSELQKRFENAEIVKGFGTKQAPLFHAAIPK